MYLSLRTLIPKTTNVHAAPALESDPVGRIVQTDDDSTRPAVGSLMIENLPPARKRPSAARALLFASFVSALCLLSAQVQAQTSAAGQSGASASPWDDVEIMEVVGAGGVGMLTDSPISVTAFDADALGDLGISDVPDLAAYTPNLEIRTAGATTPIFFIRGVGLNDFTANAAGSVAVYQDDIALNLPGFQSGQLFDLDGVEVLKGPQGSGPGRNASAGAIKIHSRKPTGDLDGFLNADFGNYNLIQFEGAVGSPIWGDLVSARFAFQFEQRDGLVKNRCGGLSPADLAAAGNNVCGETLGTVIRPYVEEDLNDTNRFGLRGALRFRPGFLDSDWTFNVHGSRVDQLSTVGQPIGTQGNTFGAVTRNGHIIPEIAAERTRLRDAALDATGIPDIRNPLRCRRDPACVAARDQADAEAAQTLARNLATGRPLDTDPFTGNYNEPGHERQETWGAYLSGDMMIGDVAFKTVTGIEHYDRSRIIDADYTSTTIFEFDIQDDAWQATQDVRFEQELDVLPLVWRAGGFLLAERLDFDQITSGSGDSRGLVQGYAQSTWSFGVYGEFEWAFMDDFDLTAGVRYNWERKEIVVSNITSQQLTGGTPINKCNRIQIDCDDVRTFSDPTGVVSLTYHFNESVTTYLKYSRGWKGAQYNVADGGARGGYTLAKPETIDSVEAGFAGSWFDGRLQMSGAFFFYAYENYQVFIFANSLNSPPVRVVRNASAAQLYGAEMEATVEPIDGLIGIVRFGWLESKFLDFADFATREVVISAGDNIRRTITEVPIDFAGNRLPNTPRFKVSGTLKYTWDFSRAGSITPRYDFTYTDDFSFDPSKNGQGSPDVFGNFFLPEFAVGQKGYVLHNARLTYRSPDETIEVALWVRNFTNEVYKQLAFDASVTAGFIGNLVGEPRTYGVSLALSF